LYRITGIDWTQINGIDMLTAQTVIAEAGADLSAFPSEKQSPVGWDCARPL
jgi:transposase